MPSTTLTTITMALLSLATSSPLLTSRQSLTTRQAFNLRAKLLDPSKDLNPPIDSQTLSFARYGLGVNVAVTADTDTPVVWYNNGTHVFDPNGAETIVTDDAGSFPLSLSIQGPDEFDATYPGEHAVGVNVNGATPHLTVPLKLSGPGMSVGGTYAVCYRRVLLQGDVGTVPAVRFVYEGEYVPEDCAAVDFLPICALLKELPDGAAWDHGYVGKVACYLE